MKTLATALNILGFTALFIAYTEGGPVDRPTGVRRALQTYAGQHPTGGFPTLEQMQERRAMTRAKV
ncbi:hypothetical protein [Mycoplana ramosa]|uniref:Uncharacterized protein n=1 Tax=Mycoplana ramosa TaxID=40837 RepID=A0ABW3YU52_MYCRA